MLNKNSLIYGIDYPEIVFDEEYRNRLEEKAKTDEGLKELYKKAMHPQNNKIQNPDNYLLAFITSKITQLL